MLGAQGNLTAPLYVGLFGFLSTQGEVTGRAFAYYDWEPARRLVVQPYAGMEAATRDIPELGLGRGLTSAELGLRVRYRIAEPFAPYIVSAGPAARPTARSPPPVREPELHLLIGLAPLLRRLRAGRSLLWRADSSPRDSPLVLAAPARLTSGHAITAHRPRRLRPPSMRPRA